MEINAGTGTPCYPARTPGLEAADRRRIPEMIDTMMERMPHCLRAMLPRAPGAKQTGIVQKMVSILAEKEGAGMSAGQGEKLSEPLTERESA